MIDRPTSDRLAKLIPLLGSDKPGEVAATAAAMDRTLRAAGADWHDIVQLLTGANDHAGRSVDERLVDALRREVRWQFARIVELEAALNLRGDDHGCDDAAQIEQATASDRRRAVLEILATRSGRDLSNREIGRRVGVSPQTVAKYRNASPPSATAPHDAAPRDKT